METASEFTCNFPNCGKTFISKSIRDRHLRVHTGERPYACPTCQRKFTQHGNMVVHMKSHETIHLRWDRKTSDKPFKCHFPSCHKSFTAKCSLQNHMQSDHNIKSSIAPFLEMEPSCAQAVAVSEDILSTTAKKIYESPIKNDLFSTVCSSSTINTTTSGCCKSQTLPDKPSEETVALSSMTKKGKLTHCQCLSCGCNDMFSKQVELKKHLFTYSPGLLGEHKFLLKVILEFSDIIIDWENAPKTNLEKELLVAYAGAVKQSVQKLIEQFPNTIEKEEKASQSLDIPPPANVDGQDPKNLDQLASLNDFVKYMSLACPPAHSANAANQSSFLCATEDENILVQSLHEDFDMFDFDAEGDDAAFDS